ncbi:hypothetical protein [Holdemania sp. Marseille-P2844]|uniref:hypothetical protein n=1 Tax=Holdemania sp. Marseille-P2844 TaxID=1852366 RepID=UPI001114D70E|nr:hypothetical protein [Holdemania sp. Marseille-P2844]
MTKVELFHEGYRSLIGRGLLSEIQSVFIPNRRGRREKTGGKRGTLPLVGVPFGVLRYNENDESEDKVWIR